mmetsp:Transcript_30134/g.33764  ORF Transcript_30134/g.33764 Transcript_30134/m.33764 type:complete len:831 (+) Transcript_30134:134-2626(+)
MVFTNELTIDDDHHPSHAHAADETAALLGRGNTNSTPSTSRASRFGWVGFLLASLALSSSAFVFLLNRGTTFPADVSNVEVQVAKEQRPSSSESSSDVLDVLNSPSWMSPSFDASETSNHVQYYTYEDFSGGGSGKPIFVVSYDDYKAQAIPPGGQHPTDLGTLLLTEAKESHATILISTSSDSVNDAIHDFTKKQKCIQVANHPANCLVLIFEEKENGTNEVTLAVSSIDEKDKRHFLFEVDPRKLNGILIGQAAIVDQTDSYNALRLSFFSLFWGNDGNLTQPDIMMPSRHALEDYCPMDPTSDDTPEKCLASNENVYILTLKKSTHETDTTKIQSRLFNGKLPGPTIKIKPGETLKVQFKNELTLQDGTVSCYADDGTVTNEYCEPDHTNLHYHGYVGSGEKPSDDVEMRIAPESQYSYMSYFKKDHMPGTHWIHAHPHGASVLQVGGGAAFALIVEDDPDRFPIPTEVESAKGEDDVILVVQHFDPEESIKGFGGSNDAVFKVMKAPTPLRTFRLVNGQYRPKHYIQPGKWQRFRVINTSWSSKGTSPLNLNLKFSPNNDVPVEKCETYLLAKDGIYINDYPRDLEFFPIPPAGRADIMVRCTNEGTYTVNHFGDKKLFTIVSEGPRVKSEEPTANYFNSTFWLNNLPQYLQDVRNETAGHGCRCPTRLSGRNRINGKTYEPHAVLHTIKLGEVIERNLGGVSFHPYHQHVYPFQLTKGFDKNEWTNASLDSTRGGYFKNGDWHDVIKTGMPGDDDEITIKYHPQTVHGKMMIHCHLLQHEDQGMMSQEHIALKHNCTCDNLKMTPKQLTHYNKKMAYQVRTNGMN